MTNWFTTNPDMDGGAVSLHISFIAGLPSLHKGANCRYIVVSDANTPINCGAFDPDVANAEAVRAPWGRTRLRAGKDVGARPRITSTNPEIGRGTEGTVAARMKVLPRREGEAK